MRSVTLLFLAAAAPLLLAPAAFADNVKLVLENHTFTPTEITVPANERFQIEVENRDSTPAEFESYDLRIEKIVVGGGKITLRAPPLKPGRYKFFDDYHPDTAQGTVVAVEKAGQ
jgi:heme/copper-type cytochrome/quinol oxidase subunit 2